ncbi:MAG TPA: hypothetical protein VJI69_05930 [Bacteroidia bacterium]|nr:hypothetical protein [Bacteroidia bacterium]
MKPILFFLTIVCIHFSVQSQTSYIDWNKKDIIENIVSLENKRNKDYTIATKDSAEVLKVEITGHEKINCEFRFDSLEFCNTSNFIYCCDACSEKHIKEFVEHKYYGWVKMTPGLYYSKRKHKTQMEIFNSNVAVTIIIFTKINWTKKEYKELIKKQ